MTQQQKNNPLHGLTLENILRALVDTYGWPTLSKKIEIRCFYNDPSIKSSLKFLRKTPWAREKVEQLYIYACQGNKLAAKNHTGKTNTRKAEPSRGDNKAKPATEKFVWPELKKK